MLHKKLTKEMKPHENFCTKCITKKETHEAGAGCI